MPSGEERLQSPTSRDTAQPVSPAVQVNESEADIVAWAWENEWGGKVFGTSFGHPGDFAEEAVVRMLVNSACWAVGKAVPGPEEKVRTWKVERADKKGRVP